MTGFEPCILLTGFEPYGGREANPSAAVAEALGGETIAGHAVRSAVLPVRLEGLEERLARLIADTQPAAIVCLGLHPSGSAIRLERFGVNLADFDMADNAGLVACGRPLLPDQPAALSATLPLAAMRTALLRRGIPAQFSNSAGTYLCNAALFTVLALTAAHPVPAGFIHLPLLPEQAAAMVTGSDAESPPSMAFSLQTDGIRLAIEAALTAGPESA